MGLINLGPDEWDIAYEESRLNSHNYKVPIYKCKCKREDWGPNDLDEYMWRMHVKQSH